MKEACEVAYDIWGSDVGDTVEEELKAYRAAEQRLDDATDGLSAEDARDLVGWQSAIGALVDTKNSGASTPAEGAIAYADYLTAFGKAGDTCEEAGYPIG